MGKKYIIKEALGTSVLALNSYGTYSLVHVSDIYISAKDIKFFDTKEEAENYIIQHNNKPVTIVEIYM